MLLSIRRFGQTMVVKSLCGSPLLRESMPVPGLSQGIPAMVAEPELCSSLFAVTTFCMLWKVDWLKSGNLSGSDLGSKVF